MKSDCLDQETDVCCSIWFLWCLQSRRRIPCQPRCTPVTGQDCPKAMSSHPATTIQHHNISTHLSYYKHTCITLNEHSITIFLFMQMHSIQKYSWQFPDQPLSVDISTQFKGNTRRFRLDPFPCFSIWASSKDGGPFSVIEQTKTLEIVMGPTFLTDFSITQLLKERTAIFLTTIRWPPFSIFVTTHC